MVKQLALISCLIITNSLHAQWKDIYKESAWADRDKWQEVDRILTALQISRNSHIADVGSHQGYMTVKLAEKLDDEGKVYAVDVDRWKLDKLEDILAERNLRNRVEVIKGDYDNPKLPLGKLDAVLIMDTYHEMDDYKDILMHVRKSLKPNGRFVLIEPIADEREKWSRERQKGKHEISIRYACKDLQKAGFRIIKEENPFVDRTEIKGDKLWMIVATPEQ